MKFIISTLLSGMLYFSLGLFLPWWSAFVAGLLIGLFMQQSLAGSFFAVLAGVFITTICYTYFTSISNDHILANRISMMILKEESPLGLIAISAAISSLSAATAALSGRSLILLFKK
ncbi:MAG: hypothetical protein RLZZ557_2080 [Bacteroidota bacterium]